MIVFTLNQRSCHRTVHKLFHKFSPRSLHKTKTKIAHMISSKIPTKAKINTQLNAHNSATDIIPTPISSC